MIMYVVSKEAVYDAEGRLVDGSGVVAVCAAREVAEHRKKEALAEDQFGRQEFDFEISEGWLDD